MSNDATRVTPYVADLVRFGAGLKIDCGQCGAARTLDGLEAFKIGGMRPLRQLSARLEM